MVRLSLSLLCVAVVILFFSNSLRVSDFRFYSLLCAWVWIDQRFWNNQQDLISQVVILIFCSLFFPVIFRSFSIWMHRFSPLFFRCAVFLRAWRFIRGSELIILCSFFFAPFFHGNPFVRRHLYLFVTIWNLLLVKMPFLALQAPTGHLWPNWGFVGSIQHIYALLMNIFNAVALRDENKSSLIWAMAYVASYMWVKNWFSFFS